MSVETLRDAARVLRERAEAATPGPWFLDAAGDSGVYTEARVSETSQDVAMPVLRGGGLLDTDRYIATVHPGVGLALADWLDTEAERLDHARPCDAHEESCSNCIEPNPSHTSALTVARAILGEARA